MKDTQPFRSLASHFLCFCVLLFLAGCLREDQIPNSPPTATAEPTETALPITPTDETLTPEIRPTPPLPSFLETNVLLDDSPPDCQLPCWHGLVAGQSTLPDVEELFQSELGFGEDFDLLTYQLPEDVFLSPDPHDDAILAVAKWRYPPTGASYYPPVELGFTLDKDTYTLQHMYFSIFDENNPPLASIVEKYGAPTYIPTFYVLGMGTGRVDLKLVYQEGMIWYYRYTMYLDEADSDNDGFADICFNRDVQLDSLMLISPLPLGLHGLTDYQQDAIDHNVKLLGLDPLNEVFGITIEELATGLIKEGDYCLTVDIRH